MSTCLPGGVHIQNPEKLFIGGKWVLPAAGGLINIVSPDTEQLVARVAEAGEADMDSAVEAARDAFDNGPWPNMTPAERGEYLSRLSDCLAKRQSELVEAYRHEIGALTGFANGMVAAASQIYAAYAAMGAEYQWETRQPSTVDGHTAVILREPAGVVAAITPWNAPYAIMTQKTGAALIAGCCVIMKPSPETPLEAYIIAEAAQEAGIPDGVINLVPAHREAADYLVRNRGVDKISFTGSTAAGRRIGSVAGDRLAGVSLELGGKSPAIILDDFPVEVAGPILARTITVMSGQVCAMLSRVLVHESQHDQLADAICTEMEKVRIGHSDDPEAEMGPIAMKRQLEKIESYIAIGQKEGAVLACGGARPAHLTSGFFMAPTLFTHVDNSMTIAQEEIFGPVLTLIPYKDLDHAIELANETQYGLNASVFTHDPDRALYVAKKIRSGGVAQNGMKADFSLPFGGYKSSGIGREGGLEGIAPYTETKVVLLETAMAAE